MTFEDAKNLKYTRLRGHTEFLNQFCSSKRKNTLHHAYLLSGHIGIGKSYLARQLAAYLLQEEQGADINANPKDEVETALRLNEDNPVWRQVFYHSHPDLIYLSAIKSEANKSGQIKLEDIKSISNLTNHQSGRGGWRVIILDSLDKINQNGANAILKLLEEPPAKTIFFLISHNISKVIPTIRSRCQHIKLGPITNQDANLILKDHSHDLKDDDLGRLISLCEGSPGMALLISSSGISLFIEKFKSLFDSKTPQLETLISLTSSWGSALSKNPELSTATIFVFDKLFSQAALFSIQAHENDSESEDSLTSSLSQIALILAERYTTNELANLHMEWQKQFREALNSYLDMSVFMQQSIYEIYSQTRLR
jgi:DNA polymerase-3 subunit delta'